MVTFAVQILEYCISYDLINCETVEFWNSTEPYNFWKSKNSSSSIFTKLASICIFWGESDSHKEYFLLFLVSYALVFHGLRAFEENHKDEDIKNAHFYSLCNIHIFSDISVTLNVNNLTRSYVALKKDLPIKLASLFVMIALR